MLGPREGEAVGRRVVERRDPFTDQLVAHDAIRLRMTLARPVDARGRRVSVRASTPELAAALKW